MQMTDAEIVNDYLHAKNQRAQVKVLAELNCCTRAAIEQILDDAGVHNRPSYASNRTYDHKLMRSLYDRGFHDGAIADSVGCAKDTVTGWRLKQGLKANPKHPPFDRTKAAYLYSKGLSDRLIGAEVGVATSTVYKWRQKNGLVPNRPAVGGRKKQD